jgi:NDP-sugar pyrophosphorylase family protein
VTVFSEEYMNTTLIIMAAGIGSRFGTGIKQLAKMAPNGEIIMDFSIYDAKAAGFTKVVFVIRKAIEAEFKEVIGNRLSKVMPIEYVHQELEDLPEGYKVPDGRVKPWGTGQAILACKSVVKEPFVIINADDYYGKEAFVRLHDFLISGNENTEKMNLAMAGFSLKNTLSENGAVTRGVCVADENGYLEKVIETTGILIVDGKIQCDNAEVSKWITSDTMVSMNMWAGYPDFLQYIDEGFTRFLDTLGENPEKKEYLLPNIVAELLEKNLSSVKVLNTSDRWIGITYKEDIEPAQEKFHLMIEDGTYPKELWK